MKELNFKTNKKTFYKISDNVSDSSEFGGNTLNNVAKGKPWAGCYAQFSQYLRILKQTKKEHTVLDVGCGQAELLTILRENFLTTKYIGLELNDKNIKKSLPLFKKPEREVLIKHDVTLGLPIQDNSIDIVVCGLLLEHVSREKGFYIFKELIRVCKPSRLIYVMIPIREKSTENVQKEHIYEWFYSDVEEIISIHNETIKVIDIYPVNVLIKDIKKSKYNEIYNQLKNKVNSNLIRIVFAPLLEKGRDITMILQKKGKNESIPLL